MTTINVSAEKMAEITAKYAAFDIAEKGRIKATIFSKGVEYVVTGGLVEGWEAHRVEDTHLYKGTLIPHSYGQKSGKGYVGMSVYFRNRTLILLEKIFFTCSEEKTEQLNLF